MITDAPTLSRSPQADIIDQLVWSKLSRFWTDGYKPEDKEAISAVYEALFTVLDAEYVRLFEIKQSRSITTCPVYSQRRWLRLDLNHYEEVRAFLRFLKQGVAGIVGGVGTSDSQLVCSQATTNHARHWHISFPWTIGSGPADLRGTMNLGFPLTSTALIEVYKIQRGLDNVDRGFRLNPKVGDNTIGWDFEILPDNKSIRLRTTNIGDRFECRVAFDLSSDDYSAFRPLVFRATTFLSTHVVQVPDELFNGLPVHAMVVRNPPEVGTDGLQITNRDDFETTRTFYPFTGDDSGVQLGSRGKIILPTSVTLSPTDVVFLFALEEGDFDTSHRHRRLSEVLEPVESGVLRSYTPVEQIPLGLFGSVDFIGQQLQIFVNGRLVLPREYSYEQGTNTFTFRNPLNISTTKVTYIDVLFTEEARTSADDQAAFHTHQSCYRGKVTVPQEFATFDDGGTFDDEQDNPPGTFDDMLDFNEVTIPGVLLDPTTVEIYLDGILLQPDEQYTLTLDGTLTRIDFSLSIQGRNILVTSRHQSFIHVYGIDDIVPGSMVYGVSPATLNNILADVQNTVARFETVFGQKVSDIAILLEAAFIAAGGGNPLFALFHDEFREYDGYPMDADNQPNTAQQARTIESANTTLIAIPFLVDQVFQPTIRLEQGADYDVVSGAIQSSVDLLAPRGPDDREPGVWWCPLTLLDEQFLAKNFGAIVGHVNDSSVDYKNALAANLALRFGGASMENIANAAAIILGSPVFTQDSKILSISPKVIGYNVTVENRDLGKLQTFSLPADGPLPKLGMPVFTGQSVTTPVIADIALSMLSEWRPGVLVVNADLGYLRDADRARITLYDPADLNAPPITANLGIVDVTTRPVLGFVETTITFDQRPKFVALATSRLRAFKQAGPPYIGFDGQVTSILPIQPLVVQTEFESFQLMDGEQPEQRIGDAVVRGQPLRPSLAEVYDHVSRPNWHWITLQQKRQHFDMLIRGNLDGTNSADQRYGTLDIGDSGFSRYTPSFPYTESLTRGTVVVLTDESNVEFEYQVVGMDGTVVLLTPNVTAAKTGLFTVEPKENQTGVQQYFELLPPKVLTTAQTHSQRVGLPSIVTTGLDGFPTIGRVNVLLAEGGLLEFEYFSRTDDRFLGCVWASATNLPLILIPETAVFQLVSEYTDKILNPALAAIVAKRSKVVAGADLVVDSQNADELYNLVRATSAVLELQSVAEPLVLDDLLKDTVPSGSTLEIVHKHAYIDSVPVRPS